MKVLLTTLLLSSLLRSAPNTLGSRLDAQVQAYADLGRFSGAVLVAQQGTVVLRKGYGLANRSWQIPNDPATTFRIASVTKQFTAAGILLLEQDGVLSTDTPISTYFPDAPQGWNRITIHHLLTHTSGLKSYTNLPNFLQRAVTPVTGQEMLTLLYGLPMEFETGSKFSYSNSGYFLLGLVIEKLTGLRYDEFLARRIFKPLGMANTGYFEHRKAIPRLAEGYMPGGDRAPFYDSSWPYAAGGLYSTVDDLFRWAQALNSETLITAASRQKMFRPYARDYGYGWSISDRDGTQVVHHGGSMEGFTAVIERVPASGLAVIVLSNLNGPAQAVGDEMVDLALGRAVEIPRERKSISLSQAEISRLVGEFRGDSGTELKILSRDQQLYVKVQRQPEFPLRAESSTVLYIPEVGVDLVAELDDIQNAKAFVLRQGKTTTRWNRVSRAE